MILYLLLAAGAVLAIIFLVPVAVYGIASLVAGLKTPEGASPLRFLAGVFVSKVGTAIAFVWGYHWATEALGGEWIWYALAWWVMFVLGELGQAIGPNYSWKEAVAGVVSETIYLPLSAFVTHFIVVP